MIPPKADPKICFRGKFNGQMNHTRIVDSKNCTSLFMKRQPRSRMERRTLPGVGRWYRPALLKSGYSILRICLLCGISLRKIAQLI